MHILHLSFFWLLSYPLYSRQINFTIKVCKYNLFVTTIEFNSLESWKHLLNIKIFILIIELSRDSQHINYSSKKFLKYVKMPINLMTPFCLIHAEESALKSTKLLMYLWTLQKILKILMMTLQNLVIFCIMKSYNIENTK